MGTALSNAGGTDNLEAALDLFERAGYGGESKGFLYAGLLLLTEKLFRTERGIGSERMVSDLRDAIATGEKEAYGHLGRAYLEGNFVEKDTGKGLVLLTEGAEIDDSVSLSILSDCYISGGLGIGPDPDKAFEYSCRGAGIASKECTNNLGVCYQRGIGCEADIGKAVSVYEGAAMLGSDIAWCNLGYFYNPQTPEGPEMKDPKKAFDCYRKAAELDSPVGCYCLAQCYEFGIGVETDISAAKEYYTRSKNGGFPRAGTALLALVRRSVMQEDEIGTAGPVTGERSLSVL